MNTIVTSQSAAFVMPSAVLAATPGLQVAPPSIHAMGWTYVPSTLGTQAGIALIGGAGVTATGSTADVPAARVRDAKQAAPPRGPLH